MGAVLVVAGTHGNELNAPWMLEAWRNHPGLLDDAGLKLELVIGNPDARAVCRRYLERDLNRSFSPALLENPAHQEREVARARHLLERHGPRGQTPCLVAIDLHSTTAAMGNCLVVYGRRKADLALAAGLQGALGLPIYLHEGDSAQTGYLVERWPCGLVVEVGPVPQGVLSAPIGHQTHLALETSLTVLAAARRGDLRLPPHLVVHAHLGSIDLPRRGMVLLRRCSIPSANIAIGSGSIPAIPSSRRRMGPPSLTSRWQRWGNNPSGPCSSMRRPTERRGSP